MGLFGLGLATAIANWIAFFVLVFHYFTKKAVFKINLSGLQFKDFTDIMKFGLPMAASQFLLAIRGITLNAEISRLVGNDGLAAFAAVGTFGYIYWAVPAGITAAMVTLASVFTGEQDRSAIKLLMKIYLRKAVPMVVGASLILSALCYPLTYMFFRDASPTVFTMTLIGFALFPLSSPFSAVLVGIRDLWRCMEYKSAVIIIIVLDGFLMVTVLSFVLGYLLGMTGIWIAQVAGCAGIVLIIWFLAWVKIGKIPTSINDLCCFPEGFGVAEDQRLSMSIHSMDEVENISEKVISFCHGIGISDSTSLKAGLCIEELAGNIVRHGFSKKSNSVVDIAVVNTDHGLIIKFKDNCEHFNPSECETIFTPDDPAHNIGLRLVNKVSKEMEYQSLLGLNVFSITL